MKALLAGVVGVAVVAGLATAGLVAFKSKPRYAGQEQQLIELTNAARAKEQVPALNQNSALDRVAREQAAKLAQGGALRFPSQKAMAETLKANGYEFRIWGLNIDAMPELNVTAISENWLGALRTRGELLQKQYQECGVGIAQDPDKTRFYFVMVLASKKS